MASTTSARFRRPATLSVAASAVLLGCASTRITTGHAQALAVRDVCARPPTAPTNPADTTRRAP